MGLPSRDLLQRLPLSFVNEVVSFNALHLTYDPSQSISKFLNEDEVRWMRIHALTPNDPPGNGQAIYRRVLECLELGEYFLLIPLALHYPNIVDNLTTKAETNVTKP